MIVYHGSISEVKKPDDYAGFSVKSFGDGMDSWIDFVCACRDGETRYRRGIWDKERALEEMKVYETYDQIAFITQRAIDDCLSYKESFEV